jgi:redox-sensitive bicupin YhaK (pirin superfamily)
MSNEATPAPDEGSDLALEAAHIEAVIVPPLRQLGDDIVVRRALPSAQRMMVGPFIFFDQMGPLHLKSGQGLDVRPHPHIGLATVTYLFDGEILHRDSLGYVQPIRPGEVNWMTAGSGIVHSERTAAERRAHENSLHGIQVWVALPKADEEAAPSFVHHGAHELPEFKEDGATVRLIAGTMYGAASPVKVFSSMFYADAQLDADARVALPPEHEERAFYVAEGIVEVGHARLETGQLAIVRSGASVTVRAVTPSRVMLLGGERADGPRHIWWNFVSSSLERIHQAKDDWIASRFARVPGETEFIPAPDRGPAPVSYP